MCGQWYARFIELYIGLSHGCPTNVGKYEWYERRDVEDDEMNFCTTAFTDQYKPGAKFQF